MSITSFRKQLNTLEGVQNRMSVGSLILHQDPKCIGFILLKGQVISMQISTYIDRSVVFLLKGQLCHHEQLSSLVKTSGHLQRTSLYERNILDRGARYSH